MDDRWVLSDCVIIVGQSGIFDFAFMYIPAAHVNYETIIKEELADERGRAPPLGINATKIRQFLAGLKPTHHKESKIQRSTPTSSDSWLRTSLIDK